jgi:hypothetical protein
VPRIKQGRRFCQTKNNRVLNELTRSYPTPKISRNRIILLLVCLVVVLPIALYVAAPRLIVNRLIGLQRKAQGSKLKAER